MVLELVSATELGRALGIEAGSRPLPLTARSLTPAQRRAPALREIGWMVAIYVLFGIACFAVIRLAETNPDRVDWLPVVFIAAGIALAFVAWRKLARFGRYQDPGLVVVVGDDVITVTGPEGSDTLSYETLPAPRVLIRTPRNSVYFDGIMLETPRGPVQLGDAGFAGGNAAAGAILRKLDELEQMPARAA